MTPLPAIQVVMQVEGLVAPQRDAVHVHTGQQRSGICAQDHAGLLDHFAAARVADEGIVRLDVSSGEQPALQAAMQHQQDAVASGAAPSQCR